MWMGQKLVKSGATGVQTCRTHISETAGWVYSIQNSMELSKSVVVQDHGLMTLTLDLHGQMLKKSYLRNRRADWHGMKQCWKFVPVRQSKADNFGGAPETFCWFFFHFMFSAWDSRHEDLQLFLLSFKHWMKGMCIDRKWDTLCGFELCPLPWPWPWILKVKLKIKLYFRNGKVS